MPFKRTTAFLLAFALLFTLTACKNGKSKADKTINYNLSAEPQTLDPQIASDPSSIIAIQALFEGLARLDANGNSCPGVAEKWAHNADNTEFTFTLRSNAKWTNKAAVTADDFVYAMRRALDPKTGSTTCTQMYCIKNARKVHTGQLPADRLGVAAKDAHTLVVDLEYSCPDFPKLTASAVYMPCNEKFFNTTDGRYGLEAKTLLGNGPFEIDGSYGWDHDKSLNLRRSDTYTGQNKPLPSSVDFSIGSTSIDASDTSSADSSTDSKSADVSDPVAALKKGTVDAIAISTSQTDAATAAGCTLTSFEDTTWGLCFNIQSQTFKNENMRKAFLQSFSRSAVLSHLPKDCTAAENIILPNTSLDGQNYRSLAGGPFYLKQSSNVSQTLSAGLSELGLSKAESATVICPDDANTKLMVNELIASWNKQFDNYFNMEPLSKDKLLERVKSGNYDIALYPVTPAGDGPLAALSLFSSSNAANPAGLKDSAYDAIIASAQEKSGKEAGKLYAEAEKFLNEKAVFYPLYYEKSYYAMAKGVTGIIFRPYSGGVDFINAGKG